jgi:4-hydroxybenzoate polyprenyltransferase
MKLNNMQNASVNSSSVWPYLQLMRPANIVTAWADILAGFAVAGVSIDLYPKLAFLLLATTGLYAGGVVFNDVCDADLDAKERPERPIPSNKVTRQGANLLALSLFSLGIIASFQVSVISGIIAISIAGCAMLYDAFSKHYPVISPLNMGICRGGNLLLGMSVLPIALEKYWFLAFFPIIYIAAITLLSQGEVHGGKKNQNLWAIFLLITVIVGLIGLKFLANYNLLTAVPFIVLFSWRVLLPFIKAAQEPTADNIRIAVKAGILSLIVLNAAFVAGFSSLIYGGLVLMLLPLSLSLAKRFAVT